MSTLILVRHGETEGQSSIRYYGRTDLALSELGRAQMRSVRDALRKLPGAMPFAHVFSSPLHRAQEGARLIVDETPIGIIEEFIEVDFGLFEGLTAEEIQHRHPAEFERWNKDRLAADYAYPGGERRSDFGARVERGLDRMLQTWQGTHESQIGCALLVAHRGVIRAIARRLARAEPVIELGSISIFTHEDGWRAQLLDAVEHLVPLATIE